MNAIIGILMEVSEDVVFHFTRSESGNYCQFQRDFMKQVLCIHVGVAPVLT